MWRWAWSGASTRNQDMFIWLFVGNPFHGHLFQENVTLQTVQQQLMREQTLGRICGSTGIELNSWCGFMTFMMQVIIFYHLSVASEDLQWCKAANARARWAISATTRRRGATGWGDGPDWFPRVQSTQSTQSIQPCRINQQHGAYEWQFHWYHCQAEAKYAEDELAEVRSSNSKLAFLDFCVSFSINTRWPFKMWNLEVVVYGDRQGWKRNRSSRTWNDWNDTGERSEDVRNWCRRSPFSGPGSCLREKVQGATGWNLKMSEILTENSELCHFWIVSCHIRLLWTSNLKRKKLQQRSVKRRRHSTLWILVLNQSVTCFAFSVSPFTSVFQFCICLDSNLSISLEEPLREDWGLWLQAFAHCPCTVFLTSEESTRRSEVLKRQLKRAKRRCKRMKRTFNDTDQMMQFLGNQRHTKLHEIASSIEEVQAEISKLQEDLAKETDAQKKRLTEHQYEVEWIRRVFVLTFSPSESLQVQRMQNRYLGQPWEFEIFGFQPTKVVKNRESFPRHLKLQRTTGEKLRNMDLQRLCCTRCTVCVPSGLSSFPHNGSIPATTRKMP